MKILKSYAKESDPLYIPKNINNVKITSSGDAYEWLRKFYPVGINNRESFVVSFLNRTNNTTGYYVASIGGRAGTVADPKTIFKEALLANACFIILSHNHPSGNIEPSVTDISLTNKLERAGEVLDLKVIDHLIISEKKYYSFADKGKL